MAVGIAHAADQPQLHRGDRGDRTVDASDDIGAGKQYTAFEIPNTLTSHTAHIHDLLFQPGCAYDRI